MEKIRTNQIIIEYAANLLDEDKLINFVNFFDFLNHNKIGKNKTGRKINGSWAYTYKGKMIGRFYLNKNSWGITFFNLFYRIDWFEKCEKHITVAMKNYILSHINTTASCCVKKTCHSKENMIILGKTFNGRVCACAPMYVECPNGYTLKYAKELILIGKNIISEIAVSSI